MSNRTSPVGPGTDALVRSIALIGMPGSGKSTLGILLAKKLGWHFVDTDIGIQTRAGETLQQIVDDRGYMHLRSLEEQILLNKVLMDHAHQSTAVASVKPWRPLGNLS